MRTFHRASIEFRRAGDVPRDYHGRWTHHGGGVRTPTNAGVGTGPKMSENIPHLHDQQNLLDRKRAAADDLRKRIAAAQSPGERDALQRQLDSIT